MNQALQQPDAREALLADGVFSIDKACEFLGLSRASVHREMQAGRLAFVKHGRRTLIPRKAAVRLLAAGVRGGSHAQQEKES